jgi:hypothetical protein
MDLPRHPGAGRFELAGGDDAVPPIAGLLSALTFRRVPAIGRLATIQAERVAKSLIHSCIDKPPTTSRVVEGYGFPPEFQ